MNEWPKCLRCVYFIVVYFYSITILLRFLKFRLLPKSSDSLEHLETKYVSTCCNTFNCYLPTWVILRVLLWLPVILCKFVFVREHGKKLVLYIQGKTSWPLLRAQYSLRRLCRWHGRLQRDLPRQPEELPGLP